jgi:Na+/phosphate symporter
MEQAKMTLTEALDDLENVYKKIETKKERISKYCATCEIEKLPFETEEKQKAEVASLLQACDDLEAYSRQLKMRIEYTNLMTQVELRGKLFTISELLHMHRKNISVMEEVYKTLSDANAKQRLRSFTIEAGKQIPIILHYKESFKNDKLDFWQYMDQKIMSILGVKNAKTELLELPVPNKLPD